MAHSIGWSALPVVLLTLMATGPVAAQTDPTIAPDALRNLVLEPGRGSSTPLGLVDIKKDPANPKRLIQARFVDVPLSRVADELGRATNSNVVVSRSVADQRVTVTLRNLDLDGLLSAIAVGQGLVTRREEDREIYFLATAEDIRGDLAAFRATRTEVFTLLYPNARDVVRVIGDTFGDQVIVTEENEFFDQSFQELQNRFRRFDVIEGRSRGLSDTGRGSGRTGVQNLRGGQFGLGNNNQNNFLGGNLNNNQSQDFRPLELPELTAQEARAIVEGRLGDQAAAALAERVATRFAPTYVTAVQRLNRVVVRSGDDQVLADIGEIIKRLDVPTSLVLLEVRVLRVDLSDGLDTSFDFAYQSSDGESGGIFSQGEIGPPADGSVLPGGSGLNLSAGVFQTVSDNFQARLQVLQTKGRVTSLATPILLTANGEVSRIFSGEQVPLVTGFTEPQVIVGDGATTTLAATPVTELRDVGTDLLITSNINADRTVTLRLLQETSQINQDGATILVPSGFGFSSETIDTVQSQSASGTIVARDGLLLAFGGLIEETESDQRVQVPVLGNIPLIGVLFRRTSSVISRSELIVLVRPYVLSTPVETDQISRNLLDSLSIHPYRPGEGAGSGDAGDWGVFREEQPPFDRSIFDLFRFRTVPSVNRSDANGGQR
ncbi:MAG: hypothetical protein AAF736_08640 [Pseudomonadota bacterium]